MSGSFKKTRTTPLKFFSQTTTFYLIMYIFVVSDRYLLGQIGRFSLSLNPSGQGRRQKTQLKGGKNNSSPRC